MPPLLWTLAFAALAAIAVGTATRMVVRRSAQLREVQDQISLILRGQVATLETNASNANKDLAGLQKAAADAKAAQQRVEIDLAKQQEKTAIAERALLELKQSLADRTITAQERKDMLAILRAKPPRKIVVPSLLSAGREALQYASEIGAVFRDAGWDADPPTGMGSFSAPASGVWILASPDAPPELVDLLVEVLISGNISTPPVNVSSSKNTPAGTVEIWVLSKAPPQKQPN